MAKLGTVWERAAEFAGERVGALSPIALGAIALPTLLSTSLPPLVLGAGPGIRILTMALAVLLSIVSMWGSLAVTAWAIDPESRAAAVALARRRLPAVLLVSIGVGAAAALLFLPIPILLGVRGYDLTQIFVGATAQGTIASRPTIDAQTGGLIGLYLLALTPLLSAVFVRLTLLGPVVLREGLLFGAVRRSWVLTRRHGWRVFGTLLLFFVIAGIAQLAAQTVFGSVFTLLFGAGPAGTLTLAIGLTLLVQAIVQTLIIVLLAAFQGKLYAALSAEAATAA
ncbi:hypothetical protein [uncultured Sphingomonas sp.]|uniref:hypothetical protein n=1 Tax=uncultured Sphingomonas sp. TaxID=158754 RepID=UPI0025DFDD24|nr:hypothetical protein [uncultured Sphingomonas sp.]